MNVFHETSQIFRGDQRAIIFLPVISFITAVSGIWRSRHWAWRRFRRTWARKRRSCSSSYGRSSGASGNRTRRMTSTCRSLFCYQSTVKQRSLAINNVYLTDSHLAQRAHLGERAHPLALVTTYTTCPGLVIYSGVNNEFFIQFYTFFFSFLAWRCVQTIQYH